MTVDRSVVDGWLAELKAAWEACDPDRATKLFEHTIEFYERPFEPVTTVDDYRRLWQQVVGLEDVCFTYEIVAINGATACVHFECTFSRPSRSQRVHLDGVLLLEFDQAGHCSIYRQWWFMRDAVVPAG